MTAPKIASPADRRTLLRIYLNDHLAGATGGVELARRCLRRNRGTALGAYLEGFLVEIVEDRRVLEDLMASLGFPFDRLKLAAAAAGEKVARLKLNGQLTGYSDLSRLLELETLCGGVAMKAHLWRVLEKTAATDPRLSAIDPRRLLDRATRQLDGLEQHRLEAAIRAFGPTT